jgi:hypothetical protein
LQLCALDGGELATVRARVELLLTLLGGQQRVTLQKGDVERI